MFQFITFACMLAVAAAKPGNLIAAGAPAVVSAYSSPVSYTSPLAYSAYNGAPLAYSGAPIAYNGAHLAYSGSSPLTYSASGAPIAYAASPYAASPYVASPYAASPYAASPYAASPYATPLAYTSYNSGIVKPYTSVVY